MEKIQLSELTNAVEELQASELTNAVVAELEKWLNVSSSKDELEKNNFSVLAPWKKFLICLAGPFSNFILAFALAFVIVSNVGFDAPIIADVTENSAASVAIPYDA